jgi:anti-anti-sigma regulatory factor
MKYLGAQTWTTAAKLHGWKLLLGPLQVPDMDSAGVQLLSSEMHYRHLNIRSLRTTTNIPRVRPIVTLHEQMGMSRVTSLVVAVPIRPEKTARFKK